jgi:outer membrane protein OmpA-like peptidoglycan-associated protein
MRRVIFAIGATLLLAASPVWAEEPAAPPGELVAQMPAPPVTYNWTGIYLGASGGGGDYRTKGNFSTAPVTFRTSQGVGLLGGQVGAQEQFGQIVLGIEGDIFGLPGKGQAVTTCNPAGICAAGNQIFTRPSFLATAGARVGWSMGDWMPYLTGGYANTQERYTATDNAGLAETATTSHNGGYGGVGVDYMFAPNWVAGIEYRHYEFAAKTEVPVNAGVAIVADTNSIRPRMDAGVFRISYLFGAPPPMPIVEPVVAPAPPPIERRVFLVFFDWDRDTITPVGEGIIEQAAAAYRAGAHVRIMVTGYTDRSGSPGYNQRLSERRANNVANALAALGVPRDQMAVSGRGENDNRMPTAPGVREPQNRRVEVVFP